MAEKDYPIRHIFRDHFGNFKKTHFLDENMQKAADCISKCKTGELGFTESECPNCGNKQIHYASCNNRNCPCCQTPLQAKWVAQKRSECIPGCNYYHAVFTIPHELISLFLDNRKIICNILFKAASDTILKICANPEYLGAKPGIIAVLHTWTQELVLHPHLHCIITGGGLTNDGKFVTVQDVRKRRGKKPLSKQKFFIPVNLLSHAFKKIFITLLRNARDAKQLSYSSNAPESADSRIWADFCKNLESKKWVVFIKETYERKEDGNAIDYLGRYVFRTAISNNRVEYDGKKVIIKYTDRKLGQKKVSVLTPEQFIQRFLNHVLLKGFVRVRCYGILANSCKTANLKKIYAMLKLQPYVPSPLKTMNTRELLMFLYGRDIECCPECGHRLCRIRGVRMVRPPNLSTG